MGNPAVVEVEIFRSVVAEAQFLRVVAAAESQSEHPIARAVIKYANARLGALQGFSDGATPSLPRVSDVEIVPGEGLRCRVEGVEMAVGNRKILDDAEIEVPKDVAAHVGRVQRDAHRVCWWR